MKTLIKNELRLTRKMLLIWMGIVLILCGFAYFEYLSLKESLEELNGLISDFPKILRAMFGVGGDLTSALGWYGCIYYWVTMLTNSYAVYLGVSCVAKERAQGTAEYLFTKPVSRSAVVCAKAVACVCNLLMLAVLSGLCNYFISILPFTPVFQGGISCKLPKDPSEIAGVSQPAGVSDLCYGRLGIRQHLPGSLYTVTFYILNRGHMQMIPESPVALSFT